MALAPQAFPPRVPGVVSAAHAPHAWTAGGLQQVEDAQVDIPQQVKDAQEDINELVRELTQGYLNITTHLTKCDDATVTSVLRNIRALGVLMKDATTLPYAPKTYTLHAGEPGFVRKRRAEEAPVPQQQTQV